MKYQEVARRLKALGCESRHTPRRGSHRKWYNPFANKTVVNPVHGANDLKIGTIRSAIRNLGIDWKDFMGISQNTRE